MAIACFRFFTRPALPRFPDLSVPCFRRRIALATDFCAAFPYLAIWSSVFNVKDSGLMTAAGGRAANEITLEGFCRLGFRLIRAKRIVTAKRNSKNP
jgi:hypothetical protein